MCCILGPQEAGRKHWKQLCVGLADPLTYSIKSNNDFEKAMTATKIWPKKHSQTQTDKGIIQEVFDETKG